MFVPDSTARGCSICRLHYIAHDTPDGGLRYEPACTCEADATQKAEAQALVELARGALDDCQRVVAATMLRRPAES